MGTGTISHFPTIGWIAKRAATNLGQVLAHRCALLGQLLALLLQRSALLQTQLQESQAICCEAYAT